ncbi:RBBP9/YdeN family alpha/beta hydrolase [Kocuria tytonis]|nr:alpha/beta fold hydrolase [Kocuria tytonis]
MTTIVMSPGYTGSEPGHWQSVLEASRPDVVRVQQRSWEHVDRQEWIAGVQRALDTIPADERIIMVGHSCGSVALAQWAHEHPRDERVAAFVLVTPADVDRPDRRPEIAEQRPLPHGPLPYPTHLVTSDDDPFLSPSRAEELAGDWAVDRHTVVSRGGHLATDDGRGRWPWMEDLVDSLVQRVSRE